MSTKHDPLIVTFESWKDDAPVLIVRELKPPFNETLVKSFARECAEKWIKAWEKQK